MICARRSVGWHGGAGGRNWLTARAVRAAFRQRLLGINPFFWLTSRIGSGRCTWAVLVAGGLVWLWGRLEFGNDWEDSGALMMWSQCLYGVMKL
jgi:hypothetical protein